MKKPIRAEVYVKRGGRCAYCGCFITLTGFHIDHVDPCWRGHGKASETEPGALGRDPGSYTLDELEPTCPRCNRWKSVLSVEEFRKEIAAQINRLYRDTPGFRLARDFGLIKIDHTEVKFFYEKDDNEKGGDVLDEITNRFLGWKLPKDFSPDCGISFKRIANEGTDSPRVNEPSGTNLLTANQAKVMLEYVVAPLLKRCESLGDDHGTREQLPGDTQS